MTIISKKHGFIFLKTRKTAGTSIEVDLSRAVEDDAVVTPIKPEVAGHVARNYLASDGSLRFRNHMKALTVRENLGREQFDASYRFCVEREPVSKSISHYNMMRFSSFHNPEDSFRLTWDEYCETGNFPVDTGTYSEPTSDGLQLLVHHVLRYDALADHLNQVAGFLGLTGFSLKARAKSEYSAQAPKVTPTPEQRRKIYEAFSPSVDLIGIDWAAPPSPLSFDDLPAEIQRQNPSLAPAVNSWQHKCRSLLGLVGFSRSQK